mmetsp:Transcript_31817/g.94982  ORF Transcript_31817/g.94982 Transcript_31817/m.94982 type:complete len:296 (-) Transcript_31817:635-1522(-)
MSCAMYSPCLPVAVASAVAVASVVVHPTPQVMCTSALGCSAATQEPCRSPPRVHAYHPERRMCAGTGQAGVRRRRVLGASSVCAGRVDALGARRQQVVCQELQRIGRARVVERPQALAQDGHHRLVHVLAHRQRLDRHQALLLLMMRGRGVAADQGRDGLGAARRRRLLRRDGRDAAAGWRVGLARRRHRHHGRGGGQRRRGLGPDVAAGGRRHITGGERARKEALHVALEPAVRAVRGVVDQDLVEQPGLARAVDLITRVAQPQLQRLVVVAAGLAQLRLEHVDARGRDKQQHR